MRKIFERFAPPGSGLDELAERYFWLGCIVNLAISVFGWIRIRADWLYGKQMYVEFEFWTETAPERWIGACDTYFRHLSFGFLMFAGFSVSFIILCYRYLTEDCRAIYLLKRLPQKRELLKQILGLSAVLMTLFLLMMVAVVFADCFLYEAVTRSLYQPEELLPLNIRRVLL